MFKLTQNMTIQTIDELLKHELGIIEIEGELRLNVNSTSKFPSRL